jgi:hypothetical protein
MAGTTRPCNWRKTFGNKVFIYCHNLCTYTKSLSALEQKLFQHVKSNVLPHQRDHLLQAVPCMETLPFGLYLLENRGLFSCWECWAGGDASIHVDRPWATQARYRRPLPVHHFGTGVKCSSFQDSKLCIVQFKLKVSSVRKIKYGLLTPFTNCCGH